MPIIAPPYHDEYHPVVLLSELNESVELIWTTIFSHEIPFLINSPPLIDILSIIKYEWFIN